MSWLSNTFHPENAYKDAQEQMNKFYDQAQNYQQPYIQHGEQAYNQLSGGMNALMDPQALQDKWASGYKESDAARQMEGMAQQHGLDAASSMGLFGSTPALQAIQAGTSGIVAQDRQKYLDDLMQKYMHGTNIAGNIYGTGANASNAASQNAMNMGNKSSELAYGQGSAQGNLMGNLIGRGVGAGAGAIGGFLMGGPPGAAAGASWGLKGKGG